jgi:3-oxoacyl-[acyl-carrier-protein] synthase-1
MSRAMRMALNQSGLAAAEIDYYCAHATSTPAGDAAEATNIRAVFGAKTPLISALKSMTGHELWMSGASQVVYSTIMAKQDFMAPNINYHQPDEGTSGLNIIRETIPQAPTRVLCNSAGFGGTNAALVLDFT